MVELSRANECLQHGFDETSIDGTPTLNQWVLLHAGEDLPPRLVTIQCAGLLVGSTAVEIASHIEAAWDIGQRAIGLLREELGGEADKLVPLTNGGVQLQKLRGIMHDTCATANLAAELIGELREISGQIQYGYEDWENKTKEDTPWFDFLFANHVRNSPLLALIDHRCAGRAEFSKRQDWCVEASWKFHNLIQPINLYCIEALVLDANVLRGSILTRVEQIRSAHLSHH
jgi:hypothetical protein